MAPSNHFVGAGLAASPAPVSQNGAAHRLREGSPGAGETPLRRFAFGPAADAAGVTREVCKACYSESAVGFQVPDLVWASVVPPSLRGSVLCLACFASYGDEVGLKWERDIQFYPVSLATHLGWSGEPISAPMERTKSPLTSCAAGSCVVRVSCEGLDSLIRKVSSYGRNSEVTHRHNHIPNAMMAGGSPMHGGSDAGSNHRAV